MTIREIMKLLDAQVLCCEDALDSEVVDAFSCDMMSDVLAFATNESLLITGLLNPQVVRTAMMLDMRCIVFVCGKIPTPEIISLARENGIVLRPSLRDRNVAWRIAYGCISTSFRH